MDIGVVAGAAAVVALAAASVVAGAGCAQLIWQWATPRSSEHHRRR